MSDEATKKISRLRQQIRSIRQKVANFNKEAAPWAQKRDALNRQIKDLRFAAKKARSRRDAINVEVQKLKQKREGAKTTVKEKTTEIKQLREKLALSRAKKPKQTAAMIKKKKDEIEWAIQTSSLTLEEEKELVKKANQLGAQLESYMQMFNIEQKIANLQGKIDKQRTEISLVHTKLTELAQQSQELHGIMKKNLNKARELQAEADIQHQTFLKKKQKAKDALIEQLRFEREMAKLQKELAHKEDEEKTLRNLEAKKKLKEEALRKLQKGKKLTLEEFKLVSEQEA